MPLLLCFFSASAQNPTESIVDAIQTHQFELAVHKSQAALKIDPRDPHLWALEGIAFERLNQPEQALGAYRAALKIDPHFLAALKGAAQVWYQKGDSHAIPLLEQVLAMQPEDPTAHAMLATMQYKANDYVHAIDNFKKSEASISNQPTVLAQYGFSLTQLKQYDEAIPIFQRVLELQSDATNARYNLAFDQWRLKHTQEALESLKPLLLSGQQDENVLNLGAEIYESEGNTPAAVELLRKAIQANPNSVNNYVAFAMLSYNHGAFRAGVDMLNVGLAQIPTAPELYLARGVLYSELLQFKDAMADFENVKRLSPRIALASTAEGIVHSQEFDLRSAVASFRASASRHPNDALTQYLLAEALEQQGVPVGSPGFREEVDAANRAVKLDPKLADAHDLLSVVYLREGKQGLAIEHSRAAFFANPEDQAAIYHLILALRGTNHNEEISLLVKQLTELRQKEQAQASKVDHYRISVEPLPKPSQPESTSNLPHQ